MKKLKVLWPHNFPEGVASSGNFMHLLAEAIRKEGVDVDLKYMGNLRSLKNIARLRGELSEMAVKYDLLHAQFGSLCGYLTATLPGVKLVSLRGSDWYGNSSGSLAQRLHGLLQRGFSKLSLPHFDEVIVMSYRMQDEILSRHRVKSLQVIVDGIDLEKFYPIGQREARERIGEEEDDSPWVLFFSLQEKNSVKRYDLAYNSYLVAKKRIPDLVFKAITSISHDLIPFYINAADAAILTSTHEGWPNCIKECLACNIPFVATDVSDLGRICRESQSCFVEKPHPELLGKRLAELILKREKSLSLRKYVESMDVKTTAKRIVDRYRVLSDLRRGEECISGSLP